MYQCCEDLMQSHLNSGCCENLSVSGTPSTSREYRSSRVMPPRTMGTRTAGNPTVQTTTRNQPLPKMSLCQKVIRVTEVCGSQRVDETQASQPVDSPFEETALNAFTDDFLQACAASRKHGCSGQSHPTGGIAATAAASKKPVILSAVPGGRRREGTE